MAHGGYASIIQIAQQAKDNQKTTQTKSNTVVTTVGLIVTCLIYILTKLMETGYDWVPEWTPQLVTFLGFAATVLGVSKTKNYVTDGTIRQLEKTALEMIDREHDTRVRPVAPGVLPSTESIENTESSSAHPVSRSQEDDDLARSLDELARKFAEER